MSYVPDHFCPERLNIGTDCIWQQLDWGESTWYRRPVTAKQKLGFVGVQIKRFW